MQCQLFGALWLVFVQENVVIRGGSCASLIRNANVLRVMLQKHASIRQGEKSEEENCLPEDFCKAFPSPSSCLTYLCIFRGLMS